LEVGRGKGELGEGGERRGFFLTRSLFLIGKGVWWVIVVVERFGVGIFC